MTIYTRAQIEGFARTAGLNDKDAKTASYIAMAESSGNSNATNHYTINGRTYYVDGLWQISTIHNLGSRESMRDPMTNARAMAKLHAESGWKPWDSSKDGKNGWASKLLGVLDKIDNPLGIFDGAQPGGGATRDAMDEELEQAADSAVDGTMAVARAVEGIVEAVDKAGNWIANPHNWLRIAYVSLGAGVVIVGLAKLIGYDSGLAPVAGLVKSRKTASSSSDETPAEKPIRTGAASTLPKHHPAREKVSE